MNALTCGARVDPNSYSPTVTPLLDAAPLQVDIASGGQLVVDRVKDASTDSIRSVPQQSSDETYETVSNVNGDGTGYKFTAAVSMEDFSSVTVVPNVTAAATVAVTVYWKLQWSIDGTNWIDDGVEVYGATGTPAATERLAAAQDTNVRSFPVAVAWKTTVGMFGAGLARKGRYFRIGQKMNAACTGTQTTDYHYQRY
jgi:hypothetical protein